MAGIVFTYADLARTRIATVPCAEAELVHSLRMLCERPTRCFVKWREHLRGRLDRRINRLVAAVAGPDAPSTPTRAVLGFGDNGVLARYEDLAIAPFWNRIRTLIDADRSRRARTLMDGGLQQLLATLHPTLRWREPVLELAQSDGHTVHHSLDGKGLLLQPSVFVWRAPVIHQGGDGQSVLLYPVSCEISGGDQEPASADLTTLVGRTRAAMLRLLAGGGGTTSELARRTELSLPAASQHIGVLRESGLITTRRVGKARFHALTPLGANLLGSAAGPMQAGPCGAVR